MKPFFNIVVVALLAVVAFLTPVSSSAAAVTPRINFEVTDEPGHWFKNTAGPIGGT